MCFDAHFFLSLLTQHGHTSGVRLEATRATDNLPVDWSNGATEATPIGSRVSSGSAARRCVVFQNLLQLSCRMVKVAQRSSQHLHALFFVGNSDPLQTFASGLKLLAIKSHTPGFFPAAFQTCVLPASMRTQECTHNSFCMEAWIGPTRSWSKVAAWTSSLYASKSSGDASKVECYPNEQSKGMSASPCSPPSPASSFSQKYWEGGTSPPPATRIKQCIIFSRNEIECTNSIHCYHCGSYDCSTLAMHSNPALVDMAHW